MMDEALKDKIKIQAQNVLDKVELGDMEQIKAAIDELQGTREHDLYLVIGQLTRRLHDTVKKVTSQVPDQDAYNVKNRLDYVIELTENAANKTMDAIEATLPLSEKLARESRDLLSEWTRLGKREMEAGEFRELYKTITNYWESVTETVDTIHHNLQNVLVAQNFQDLTGQTIRKVIHSVSDLEEQLVQLVAVASQAGFGAGADEPKEEPKEASVIMKNQDEVDDLLSSLGF